MNHKLQCNCGALSGEVSNTHSTMRVACYCKDCQAYAQYLGKSESVLDAQGGTDIVSTQANQVAITNGNENLACVSLSENGLLRWYAKCCNTPIANTPRDWKFPYVGLVHTSLGNDPISIDSSFSKTRIYLNTGNTKNAAQTSAWRKAMAILGFIPKVLFVKLSGQYKHTPFFLISGTPVTEVTVLSKAELEQANNRA